MLEFVLTLLTGGNMGALLAAMLRARLGTTERLQDAVNLARPASDAALP